MKMQLTQQIVVSNKSNKFSPLDELCFLSKNLYNVALYHLNTLFAGKNVGWKDSINLGRTNN